MTYGIQMWDNSGNEILNISDSLTKFVAAFSAGPGNGSTSFPALSGLRPWFTAYRLSNVASQYYIPVVSISGTTVSWNYTGGNPGNDAPVFIIVGVY